MRQSRLESLQGLEGQKGGQATFQMPSMVVLASSASIPISSSNRAALKDPSGLFNSSLDGNTRRAIDFHEGEKIDEEALKTLVRAAVTLNKSTAQS